MPLATGLLGGAGPAVTRAALAISPLPALNCNSSGGAGGGDGDEIAGKRVVAAGGELNRVRPLACRQRSASTFRQRAYSSHPGIGWAKVGGAGFAIIEVMPSMPRR